MTGARLEYADGDPEQPRDRARRGDILGAGIVGAAAAEIIAASTLAIDQKLNIDASAGVIVPYPTCAEVGKRAAMTYFTRGLTSPPVRRIIGRLRRFGRSTAGAADLRSLRHRGHCAAELQIQRPRRHD